MPIIDSLLQNDQYKFSMLQFVLHQFPGAEVEYEFKHRKREVYAFVLLNYGPKPEYFEARVKEEIKALEVLRFTEAELYWLGTLSYLKPDFIEFLRGFHLNSKFVHVWSDETGLRISIKGPWLQTILFEVPILAIVNQVYFEDFQVANAVTAFGSYGNQVLTDKIALAKDYCQKAICPFYITDFGTRRRLSSNWHRHVVTRLKDEIPEVFVGTSNLKLAMDLNLPVVGTQAHEIFQACQALGPRLVDSQKFALQKWADEYRGELGIALTDIVGIDAFLRDFDLYFANLYQGIRQDSGDVFEWGEKVVSHYKKLGIDPMTKKAVFSDGLTFQKAIEIHQRFAGLINMSFGIGTSLSNDVSLQPLQIVLKMTKCQGQTVAKISDSKGKEMCEDKVYTDYLKKCFQIYTKEQE